MKHRTVYKRNAPSLIRKTLFHTSCEARGKSGAVMRGDILVVTRRRARCRAPVQQEVGLEVEVAEAWI